MVTTFENRPGRKGAFVGVWLTPEAKRRLAAMSLVRGESASKVLRGLIDAAPIEEKHNGSAQVSEARAAAVGA